MCKLLARHGLLKDAAPFAEQTYSLGLQSLYTGVLQSYCLWLTGERQSALEQMQFLYSLAPRDPGIQLHLEGMLRASGKTHEAKILAGTSPISAKEREITLRLMEDMYQQRSPRLRPSELPAAGEVTLYLLYLVYPSYHALPEDLEQEVTQLYRRKNSFW